jgi:hypothetical protein
MTKPVTIGFYAERMLRGYAVLMRGPWDSLELRAALMTMK